MKKFSELKYQPTHHRTARSWLPLVVVLLLLGTTMLWMLFSYVLRLAAEDAERENDKAQVAKVAPASETEPLAPAWDTQLAELSNAVDEAIAQGDTAKARARIAQWKGPANEAQIAYLSGQCDLTEKKLESAELAFQKAISSEPTHRAALANLGLVLEQQERVSEALPHYEKLHSLDLKDAAASLSYARILRKLGRAADADTVLPIPLSSSQVPPELAIEFAEREYARGKYAEAVAWFEVADLDGSHIAETLRTAASAYALNGNVVQSQALFKRVDTAQANFRHINELQRRLQINPNDQKSKVDLKQMANDAAAEVPVAPESELYHSECAACHGVDGSGDGLAARFLFPRPRNLRSEPYRIVTTQNAIADDRDIARVIRRGLPGTSMPAFPELNEQEIAELVKTVNSFRQADLREPPAHTLPIPEFPAATDERIAKGGLAFKNSGCSSCHSSPSSPAYLFDSSGRPTQARNLAEDLMKGGSDAAALYARIKLGMPGTPHPALDVAPETIIELVLYCQSLSTLPKRILTNRERFDAATAP